MLDEAKIREAVEKAKAAGWTIADEEYVNRGGLLCCPLGALALSVDPACDIEDSSEAAPLVGAPSEICRAFANGFDAWPKTFGVDWTIPNNQAAYDLGAKFRRELIK